ncbi:MAG TPA: hypothetical protein VLG15_10250, partial [Thermoanaerobaculia bacterium]|nr:hypothetical protein [Thermoanaerobaculia bacterium]
MRKPRPAASPTRRRPDLPRFARTFLPLAGAAILFTAACASSGAAGGGSVARRADQFPLDPREELTGPFPEGVASGWEALVAGDPAAAEAEFLRARATRPYLAAEIGLIE